MYMTDKEGGRKMTQEITPDVIGQEFDRQMDLADPFAVMRQQFDDYSRGPLVIGLGAVGGSGAGEKARGILQQFTEDDVPYIVIAMEGYLSKNPLIATELSKGGTNLIVLQDGLAIGDQYQAVSQTISQLCQTRSLSGVLSLGPRTYFPEGARRNGLPAMIIDGAVPDMWSDSANNGSVNTEYYTAAYESSLYATTCGFSGWLPPRRTYPPNMKMRVVGQPFSKEKIAYLRQLRNTSSKDARAEIVKSGAIDGLTEDCLILVPTMDQVYLNPMAFSINGGVLSMPPFGKTYSFMAEILLSSARLAGEIQRSVGVYVRPGILRKMLEPILSGIDSSKVLLLGPADNDFISNDQWLLLRKAGIAIGRAPLCVSTAEALGMGDYQITTAVPGRTGDGISYMTEAEGLEVLDKKKVTRTLFPGESMLEAVRDVTLIKGLV